MQEGSGRVLVLGIGNILLTDEGVGVHAMRALAAEIGDRADIDFIDGGTLSFTLAGPIAECSGLIVLDTAALNEPPGTVRALAGPEMDRFLATGPKTSVHEVSLSEVMGMALAQDALPARRMLIGIQPQDFSWGEAPTPEVAAAIPEACAIARATIAEWTA